MMHLFGMKKLAAFCGGVLFGTAGLKILSSRDAKRVYAETTAAAIRAKDCLMETASRIRENADDVLADAKEINARRAAEEEALMQEDECCGDEDDEEDEPGGEAGGNA